MNQSILDSVDTTICIANIGPQQQRLRLRFGLMMFAIGIVIAVVILVAKVDPGWRIGLFAPFYLGAVGVFQAHDKT